MSFENIPEFDKLWDKYVPTQGEAKTEFGEVVRALGRLEWDYYNNGFQNAKEAMLNPEGDDEDDGHDWHDDIEGYEWNHYYLDLFNKLSDFVQDNGGPRDAMDIIEAATPENDSGEELFSDACKTLKTFLIQKEPKNEAADYSEGAVGWCVVDDGIMVDGPFETQYEAKQQAKFLSDIPGAALSVKYGSASDKGYFVPAGQGFGKYAIDADPESTKPSVNEAAADMPDHDFTPAALDRIMYEIEVETGKRVTAELSDVRMVDNLYRATIGLDNDTYIIKFDCNSEGEDFDLGYINRSNDMTEDSDEYDLADAYDVWDPKHPNFRENWLKYKDSNPTGTVSDYIAHLRRDVKESVVSDVLSALDGFAISDQYK